MALHNDLGKQGEHIAQHYLNGKGYKLLEKNWRCPKGEIDLIFEDKGYIVFVEVKTRSTLNWGNPQDAVSSLKIKRIVEIADYYMQTNDCQAEVRFDIVAITLNNSDMPCITHIEDAFVAPIN